jgi:hypothetical protein
MAENAGGRSNKQGGEAVDVYPHVHRLAAVRSYILKEWHLCAASDRYGPERDG